jgi:hypothetical protein
MPIHAGGALEYALKVMHERLENPAIEDLALLWVNSAKDFVVSYGQWRWLEGWGTLPATSTGIVYFPDHVWEITSLFPSDQGYRSPVNFLGGPEFDRTGATSAAGLPDFGVPHGRYGVELDNPSTGVLVATSSAGAGDEGIEVTIEGEDANYRNLVETVTLNGSGTATTSASFRAGVDGVRRVTINDDSRFTVAGAPKTWGTLTVTRAGTTIETLDIERELSHEHLRYEIYPAYTSGTFTYRYYRRWPDLISLDQMLEIPNEHKDAFVEHIKGSIAEFQNGISAGAPYWAKADAMLKQLRWREQRQPGRKRGFYIGRGYDRRGWR